MIRTPLLARLGAACLVLGATTNATMSTAQATAKRAARVDPTAALDAYFAQAIGEWEVPGMSVAIVRGDSVVFARGYGVRELGKTGAVDDRTLFAIGSSSKAFTVALLGMLVDEGKIRWDDPVTKHLPEFQLADPWLTREVTVRDLVTHRVDVMRADAVWEGTSNSRAEIVRRARFLKPTATFRSRFDYNNIMFIAAGELAARKLGMSWDDAVRQRIFAPLGMASSNTSTHAFGENPNVATPHGTIDGTIRPIEWKNIDNAGPAGSINSSAREMAQWLRLQLAKGSIGGKQLVSAAQIAEMHMMQMPMRVSSEWSPVATSPIPALMVPGTNFMGYGLGWFLQDYRGYKVVGHGGAIDGMRAQVAMIPSEKLGLVILTNLDQTSNNLPEALIFRIFDAYLGGAQRDWSADLRAKWLPTREALVRSAAAKPATPGKPSLPLEQYTGSYADSLLGEVRVSVENGKLVAALPNFIADLEPWGYESFLGRQRNGLRLSILFQFAPAQDLSGRPGRLIIPMVGEYGRR